MKVPQSTDYIDIHTHGGLLSDGIFFIENLLANENQTPDNIPELVCSYGIHPWYLNAEKIDQLIEKVKDVSSSPNLIALGEAGFDKLRGPSLEIQLEAFERQIVISEELKKPVIIHCVRGWDELIPVHKKLKPKMPWLIHGFRGKQELAKQLISKGFYLSFWSDFALRQESENLLRTLPKDKIFLETDGADVDIRDIYKKVASDLEIPVAELKSVIHGNFRRVFKL